MNGEKERRFKKPGTDWTLDLTPVMSPPPVLVFDPVHSALIAGTQDRPAQFLAAVPGHLSDDKNSTWVY